MKVFNRYPADTLEKFYMNLSRVRYLIKYKSLGYFNSCKKLVQGVKPIRILCVLDRSCNNRYMEEILLLQRSWALIKYKIVNLTQYLKVDESEYDLIIYQTWTSDLDYAPKADEKFINSKLPKILFDAHASGSYDTYFRFKEYNIPRIKNAPHKDIMDEYSVFFPTTHPITKLKEKKVKKEIDISYCVGHHTHPLRPEIHKRLLPYKEKYRVDLENNVHNYTAYLRRVKISVNAPGYGEGTFRHLYTLNAKSLLFAHESISSIKLLPYADLIDGKDYVSFNMDNFDEKLQYYLDNPEEAELIAQCGYARLDRGYNFKIAAKELLPFYNQIFQICKYSI